MISEEFKGTGNSEIVLDRELANRRIVTAIKGLGDDELRRMQKLLEKRLRNGDEG